jgi:hypothetical protein
MNDKIKELLEQSGFQYIKHDGIGWAGNYNASLPMFAELIVRECIELNRQELSFNAFARMLDKYNEHFGVDYER